MQLGGSPDWSPDSLSSRSHAEYVEGNSLLDMIREDLVAERVAIDSYREFIEYLGENDSTTRRMLEEILRVEEDHANELSDFLDQAGDGQAAERVRRHNACWCFAGRVSRPVP